MKNNFKKLIKILRNTSLSKVFNQFEIQDTLIEGEILVDVPVEKLSD